MGHHVDVTLRDLDLWSSFDLDFKINMHKFRRFSTGRTRWRLNYFTSFLSSKVICQKHIYKKGFYFELFWSLWPNLLGICQLWWQISERTSQKISAACFSRPPAYNSFWDNGTFPKKIAISLNLTFVDLWWPQYWHKRKTERSSFGMIFDELSNVFSHFFVIVGHFFSHCWLRRAKQPYQIKIRPIERHG